MSQPSIDQRDASDIESAATTDQLARRNKRYMRLFRIFMTPAYLAAFAIVPLVVLGNSEMSTNEKTSLLLWITVPGIISFFIGLFFWTLACGHKVVMGMLLTVGLFAFCAVVSSPMVADPVVHFILGGIDAVTRH